MTEQTPGKAVSAIEGPRRRQVMLEVGGLYLATLLAVRALVSIQATAGLPDWVLLGIPVLFIYVPILWLERKHLEPAEFGLALEGLWPALKLNALLAFTILGPFVLANHVYQGLLFGRHPQWLLPERFWTEVVAYHILVVALPEEFFYRGYMQSRLNQVFDRRWRFLGVPFGWSLFITAVLFAAGHSLVVVRWWHFSIFFPALVFGWVREKTGNVLASALFHGLCNIVMVTLDTCYGVIPP